MKGEEETTLLGLKQEPQYEGYESKDLKREPHDPLFRRFTVSLLYIHLHCLKGKTPSNKMYCPSRPVLRKRETGKRKWDLKRTLSVIFSVRIVFTYGIRFREEFCFYFEINQFRD